MIACSVFSTIQGTGDITASEVATGHARTLPFILSDTGRGDGLDREVTESIW